MVKTIIKTARAALKTLLNFLFNKNFIIFLPPLDILSRLKTCLKKIMNVLFFFVLFVFK